MSEELFPVEAPAHRPRRRTPKSPSARRPATPATEDLFDLPEADESVLPGRADLGATAEPANGEHEQRTAASEPVPNGIAESSAHAEEKVHDAPSTPETAGRGKVSAEAMDDGCEYTARTGPNSVSGLVDGVSSWAGADAGRDDTGEQGGHGGADAGAAGGSGRGFELCGELPSGTTVLEASAGTGKTYAIVGLAVRYVAEREVDISELLLVTFSRAATQELRERTRDRFVAAAAALADPETAVRSDDELIRHLAQADSAEIGLRRSRLLAALSEFDAGTIATTHSFCQRMLDELGLAGEHDPGVRLVENVDDLVATVTEDLFLARYARAEPPFSMKDARALADAAVRDRQARLVPEEECGDATASERVAFGAAVRAETERRKRLSGLRDFDDLLVLLHDVLDGERARDRIRERFRVALVDEFQDTDPLQWEILRRCFHEHATLVLVGDPKQAIYAFRGAEVLSYLDAVAVADQRRELTVNRRSDAGLLAALNHLMGGAALGHKEIGVHPVAAVRPHTRLSGEGDRTPLRLRWFRRTGAGPLNKSGFPAVGRQRSRVAADLAADIVQQLDSDLRIGDRPLGPGDIAVLVRTRSQIDVVRAALDEVGVASVLAGGASVFATRSATDWLWLLRALEQPHRADRVRLAAGTPLLGYSAAEIDSGGADLVGRVGQQLRESARLFGRAGFAAVAERLAAETRLAARLLAVAGGERELTDLRHIAQLIDQVALRESLGLSALTRWLGDRVRDPASGAVADRSRRLDRDAAAVQIATVHASKGLEFPLVYLPFAWDNARNPYPATLMFHDERGKRVLDVGGPEAVGYNDRKRRSESEEAGEELRLLYVALTRAQCQVVAWWAPTYGTAAAPLHRMMLGRMPGSAEVPGRAEVPADNVVGEHLSRWAQGAPDGVVAVRPVEHAAPVRPRWERAESSAADLAAAQFDRVIDQDWRRTSYSALTAGAHDMHVAESEADTGISDEPAEPSAELPEQAEFASAAPSLMNDLPYGAEFGTLVHGVLEYVDTDAPDLAAEVRTRCADAIGELLADIDPDALATALLAVLHTPMATGSLAEVSGRDRLSELDFELPLAGGDTPRAERVTVRRIADLLRAHLPADDPFAGYADQLDTLPDTPLRGFLTGSIDAVLRTAGPRFVVVDYKTNRLGTGDLTVAHYTRGRMAAEMMRSHYPLQAILYSAALHRYLRWRLPDYDPARHLGGIRYLFVRGMIGPGTPSGCGVFDWDPPPALAGELSDLLAGRWR
ncbi:UvrD-helicase domain-containing protein [Nocardia vaccinii]|uniref:UvrD-helicase domain-containing protein n=1 Tax=Nocardia vaccinii TaxID=1822 RepID=UPI000AB65DE2|nr:UvrD-helicase domain-containing protein [Nocardia vaccinii]